MSWTRKPAAQGAWGEGKGGASCSSSCRGSSSSRGMRGVRERGGWPSVRVLACACPCARTRAC